MGQQVSKRARGDRHRYGKVRLFNLRERGDLLMRKPVAITLQYTSMSNQHVVRLKFIHRQLYLNKKNPMTFVKICISNSSLQKKIVFYLII